MGFVIVAAVVLLIAGSATTAYASICNTVDTRPFWDNNITNGWFAQAQTFEAPAANCNVLSDWTFALAGRTSPGAVTFSIYQWGPTGPIGSPLFTTNIAWGTTNATYSVPNINVVLTPGTLYGADIDLQGYSGPSVYFNGNKTGYKYDGWWYMPSSGWNDLPLNQYFAADFSNAVPEPGSILLLGTSLLGAAGVLRRRIKL
jgi:hypothetical protein